LEVFLHAYFNKPEQALNTIHIILDQYQNEVDVNNMFALIKIYCDINFSTYGNFREAYEMCDSFLGHIKNNGFPEEEVTHFTALNNLYAKFKDLPSTQIIRPNSDVEVPFRVFSPTIDQKNNSTNEVYANVLNSPVIKVNIHGKDYVFLFDTGSSHTIFFEKTATELNLLPIYDDVSIEGIGSSTGSMTQLDSLSLGDILVKNPLIVITENIFLEKLKDDSANMLAGVFGLDLMKKLGEIQIAKNGGKYKMTIPAQQTDAPELEQTMLIDTKNQPYVLATLDGESAVFHLDTGLTSTDLTHNYFQKNKTHIEANFSKGCSCSYGFGGGKDNDIYVHYCPVINQRESIDYDCQYFLFCNFVL